MKGIILSILLFSTAIAVQSADIKCLPNDNLIPNPIDCASFYTCANGIAVLTQCSTGLWFHYEIQACDYPRNVDCEAASTTSTVKPTTTSSTPRPTTSRPTTTSTTPKPTTERPTTSEPTSTPEVTTAEPSTPELTTTPEPTTTDPSTLLPTTAEPSTPEPTTTPELTTAEPSTPEPTTTPELTTAEPSTPEPTTTPELTTAEPSTPEPTTTAEPSTTEPTTTAEPSTPEPTTTPELSTPEAPTTIEPTTPQITTTDDITSEEPCTSTPTPTTTSAKPETTTSTPNGCPPTGSELIPNPDDCRSFIVCINGDSLTVQCPEGLQFDSNTKRCSKDAECSTDTTTAVPTTSEEPTTTEEVTTPQQPSTTEETTTTEQVTTTKPSTTEEITTTEQVTTTEPSTTEEITTTEPPTTTENITTTQVPTTENPLSCPVNGSALLPIPSNCTAFLVCINGGSLILNCPEDLQFDSVRLICDDAETVQCGITTTEQPNTTEEPTSPTSEAPESTTTEESTPTVTQEPATTTTAEPSSTTTEEPTTPPAFVPDCPETGYAVLENPESCSSFYVCINGVYGLVNCPSGLDFNIETVKCDLPANPDCRSSTTEEPSPTPPYVPPCPENGTIELEDPVNCKAFYICINGQYAHLKCPGENFQFNTTTQSCEWTEELTCAPVQMRMYTCEEDGNFPDPEDCGKYYVCDGIQQFHQVCPGGLHFNPILGMCDNPSSAQCEIGTSTDAPTKPTTVPPTTQRPTTEEPTSTTQRPTTEEPPSTTQRPTTEAPPSTISPVQCPSEGVILLPDPEDCTQFYVCIDGEHEILECPQGYGFDVTQQECVPAETIGCNEGTLPPGGPECPAEGTAKLPNPEDCASYYFCISGHPALINCPDGLNFDEKTGVCSESAECLIESTTSHPTSVKPTSTTGKPTTSSSEKPDTTSQKPTTSNPESCSSEGTLFPNPNDCKSFFQCANGVLVKIDCPAGLEYNEELQSCDHPESANCKVQGQNLLVRFFRNMY